MDLNSALEQLPSVPRSAAEKMREAFELHEQGVRMKRRSLRRTFPDESEVRIEERLASWLRREDEVESC